MECFPDVEATGREGHTFSGKFGLFVFLRVIPSFGREERFWLDISRGPGSRFAIRSLPVSRSFFLSRCISVDV